jgi:hypothetical protein
MLGAEESTSFSAEESGLTIKVRAAGCSVSSRTGSSAGEATACSSRRDRGFNSGLRIGGASDRIFLLVDSNSFGCFHFCLKILFDIIEIGLLTGILVSDPPSFLGTELDYFVSHLLVQPLKELEKAVDIGESAFRNEGIGDRRELEDKNAERDRIRRSDRAFKAAIVFLEWSPAQ